MWFHRFLFALVLCVLSLHAAIYPKTFASLGTPLYKAQAQLDNFSNIEALTDPIATYKKDAKKTLNNGFSVDKSVDKKSKFMYLKELRALQKEYDYIVHLLRLEIQKAIKNDDAHAFEALTSYELESLLAPTALREQAIDYYKKHTHKRKSTLLEKQIKEKQLYAATQTTLMHEIRSSQFNSQSNHVSKHKDVYVTVHKTKKYIDIFFTNTNIYDVTLQVRSKGKNDIFVVKAKSKKRYTRFYFRRKNAGYSMRYSWILGSKDAKVNEHYIYRLPYMVGTVHMVTQGFHGKATHKGHSEYAVDFKMDVGTKIYAARGGIVVKTKDDSNKRGFAKKFARYGNYVTVLHDDGTFGTYYHLKKGGVLVSVGQRVYRGSALGYSGNTGYTSGPHLHFEVFKATNTLQTRSLPIQFVAARGVISDPKKGEYYKAK